MSWSSRLVLVMLGSKKKENEVLVLHANGLSLYTRVSRAPLAARTLQLELGGTADERQTKEGKKRREKREREFRRQPRPTTDERRKRGGRKEKVGP